MKLQNMIGLPTYNLLAKMAHRRPSKFSEPDQKETPTKSTILAKDVVRDSLCEKTWQEIVNARTNKIKEAINV